MDGLVWADAADIAVTHDGLCLLSFRGPAVVLNPQKNSADIVPSPVGGVMMTEKTARELASALGNLIIQIDAKRGAKHFDAKRGAKK
jgi:hypothetical protein